VITYFFLTFFVILNVVCENTAHIHTIIYIVFLYLAHYKGYYCPPKTGLVLQPCPTGTFSPLSGLQSSTECLPCSAGRYCDRTNATTPAGPCEAGFYCHNGSDTATPTTGHQGFAGICPAGSYCKEGDSSAPVACPEGTFNNNTHGRNMTDCTLCTSGYYCGTTGLESPTGKCAEGFYCRRSAKAINPITATNDNGPCPTGHYCPMGTGNPYKCEPGTYNSLKQQKECFPCLDGHFCNEGASNSTECPMGYYCPNG